MNDSLNNKWLSISEVADLTGLRPSSLRYWARNGVFKRHGVRVSSWGNGVLRLLHCMRSFVHGIVFVE